MIEVLSKDIGPYLDKAVIVTLDSGEQFSGLLTNYIPEIDDDDNLIETVDLKPQDATGHRFEFNLKQITRIESID